MTMSRKDKKDHKIELQVARETDGMTSAKFASPTEIARRGGRSQMTAAEYVEHRMHRHHSRVPAEYVRETKATNKIQAMRSNGRTRIDYV